METKDYLIREIEKIGTLLQGIIDKFKGSKKEPETLLTEVNDDLDKYLGIDLKTIAKLSNDELILKIHAANIQGSKIKLLARVIREYAEENMEYDAKLSKALIEKGNFLYEYKELDSSIYSTK